MGWWRWSVGLMSGLLAAVAAAADLIGVDLAQGEEGRATLALRFSEPPGSPGHFQTAAPPRLIVDFVGAKSRLDRAELRFAQAGLDRVNVLEAGGRLRLVLLLDQPVRYELLPDGNGWQIAWQRTPGAASDPVAKGVAVLSAPRSSDPPLPAAPQIKGVDFRRGDEGQGRIVVTLSSPRIAPDLRQNGERLEVRFPSVTLPQALVRRSDVTEFATPVREFTFEQQGGDAVLTVRGKGVLRPTAYQADTTFVLEVAEEKRDEESELAAQLKPKYSGERLTLDFQNVEVRALLQVLAEFSGFNIVAADSVTGTITLRLKEVPWDQALDIILQAKGLDKRQNGNVIWVAPTQEIADRERVRLEAFNQKVEKGVLVTEAFQINYHSAAEIYQMLIAGRAAAGAGTAGNAGAGAAGGAQGAAAGGGGSSQSLLSSRGSATFDMRTNKLFVTDVEERLNAVRALLKEIDVPPKQVVIEARIVEATTNFGRELGARLGFDDARIRSLGGGALYTVGPFTRPFSRQSTTQELRVSQFSNFQLSIFNRSLTRYLNLELNLAEATGQGRIISSPKIMTANNVKAKLSVGDEIPYVLPATSNTPSSVSFKEAALNLEVTPMLTPDGRVRMSVLVEKNRADFTRTVLGNPPIVKKQVTTDVIVENGGTVVLGGLFEESETQSEDKVPFLGDIPVVGNLFKNQARAAQRTELMIFLTPRIVSDDLRLR